MESLLNPLAGLLDAIDVIALGSRFELIDLALDILGIRTGHFITQIAKRFFRLIDKIICGIPGVDHFTALLVFSLMLTSLLNHAIDVALIQVGRSGNSNLLLLARGFVLGCHM